MDSELNIKFSNDMHIITINPKVYDLDVIYSAAYVMLDRGYFVLDGDPSTEIIVKIKPKDKDDKEIALDFNNELINYGEYKINFDRNKDVRLTILQKALVTNDPDLIRNHQDPINNQTDRRGEECKEEIFDDIFDDDDDYLDDPDGIAIPWEEKYGTDKDKTEQ